jgi:FdhD protein
MVMGVCEMSSTTRIEVTRVDGGRLFVAQDVVVRERPVTLFLNDEEFATIVCSPVCLKELAVGFLCSEGILQKREDLKDISINETDGLIWVETMEPSPAEEMFLKRYITTCCGRGRASFYFVNDARNMSQVRSELSVRAEQALTLSEQLEKNTVVFQATGGTHGAALCTNNEVLLTFEDVGRHNAVDKIFGRCFLEGISTTDKLVVFSGRVSSEILIKIARMGIPIIISRGAPTDLALEMADELGVTVIGFARGKRLNIYTHAHRVKI